MAAPHSLLEGARAFARDFTRDQMPKGYLWDVVDYVPTIVDATLTGRGGWRWGTNDLGGIIQSGILAPFVGGDQLLFQTTGGRLVQVDAAATGVAATIADRGAIVGCLQNPVFRHNETIWFDWTGTSVPYVVRASGPPVAVAASAPHPRVGCIWGEYLVVGGAAGEEDVVRFSHPTNDLTTAGGWDAVSSLRTSSTVTALAALRAVIIVFHAGSAERIRGSIPPNSAGVADDLNLEPLFSHVGCPDPKALASWNENVVFADEHGVHVTDGAVIRNLVSQGGILTFWRNLWYTRTSVSATTFLDYYMITLGQSTGSVTLVVDLNKRQWFRLTNMPVGTYVSSGGSSVAERVWGGLTTANRAIRVGPVFFPAPGGQLADDDGTPVLPVFETPWYRLGEEGRKRVRFAYLSYDARSSGSVASKVDLDEEEIPPPATPELAAALAPVLEVGYIRSPQQTTYTALGQLPFTSEYSRYRLPLGQFPYGVAFRVRQTAASTVTRIFDLAVEAQAAERSRV